MGTGEGLGGRAPSPPVSLGVAAGAELRGEGTERRWQEPHVTCAQSGHQETPRVVRVSQLRQV